MPYAVLKISPAGYVSSWCELDMQRKLSRPDWKHPGRFYVQVMTDHFEIITLESKHQCLVYEPMRETMDVFQSRMKRQTLPLDLLKIYLKCILEGLDFLHEDLGLIHAGKT